MKNRPLGQTDLKVSEIGFGCWGIGGDAYGTTDDSTSIDALQYASKKGVKLFDTSDLYGFGKSEKLIGQALSTDSTAIIASKGGAGLSMEKQNFFRDYLEECFEASLKRLQASYIGLYQLHNPSLDDVHCDSAFEFLHELKRKGKIGAVGLSVKSPEEALKAVERFPIDSIQVNFNLLDQRAYSLGVFAKAKAKGVGIIVRTPLCFGFLSGQYKDVQFEKNDHRSQWSPQQRQTWAEGIEKFLSYKKSDETSAQFAIRFCLSFSEVSTTIPGMLTREHVDENSSASGLTPFSPREIAEIHDHYKKFEFFVRGQPRPK